MRSSLFVCHCPTVLSVVFCKKITKTHLPTPALDMNLICINMYIDIYTFYTPVSFFLDQRPTTHPLSFPLGSTALGTLGPFGALPKKPARPERWEPWSQWGKCSTSVSCPIYGQYMGAPGCGLVIKLRVPHPQNIPKHVGSKSQASIEKPVGKTSCQCI